MTVNAVENVKRLIKRARAGDSRAFDVLCGILRENLFQQLYGKYCDRDMCDELAQKTLCWFLDNFNKSIRDENIPALLASKAFFLSKSHFRKKYSRMEVMLVEYDSIPDFIDESSNDGLDPQPWFSKPWGKIESALPHLNPIFREVLEKRYYYEYTIAEIAEELNLSEENVRQSLKRGLDELRELVKKSA